MESVLLNELDAEPVAIPVEAVGVDVTPPPGAPDLSLLALGIDDLPAGFAVAGEGYDSDPVALAEYERDFDAFGQVLGSSELLELEDTVALFRNAAGASAFMEFMTDFFTGPTGPDAFAQGEFSIVVDKIAAEPIDLGDEAILLTASGSSPIGDVEFAIFLVRVDGLMSTLIASGRAERFAIEDITPLAEAVAERLRQ